MRYVSEAAAVSSTGYDDPNSATTDPGDGSRLGRSLALPFFRGCFYRQMGVSALCAGAQPDGLARLPRPACGAHSAGSSGRAQG